MTGHGAAVTPALESLRGGAVRLYVGTVPS